MQGTYVCIKAAEDKKFKAEGAICPTVVLRVLKTTIVSPIAPKLATRTVLGTMFIDIKIERIEINNEKTVRRGGHAVAIVGNFVDENALFFYDTKIPNDIMSETETATRTVAGAKKIPPRSKGSAMVFAKRKNILMAESVLDRTDKNRALVLNSSVQFLFKRPL